MIRNPDIILLAAAAFAIPALLWGVLAYLHWTTLRRWRSAPETYCLPALSTFVTYAILVEIADILIRPELEGRPIQLALEALQVLNDILLAALLRHFIVAITSLLAARRRTTHAWLAKNYGAAAVVAPILVGLVLLGQAWWGVAEALKALFILGMSLLAVWEVRHDIRGVRVRLAALHSGALHPADFVVLGFGVLLVGTFVLMGGLGATDIRSEFVGAVVAMLAAIPFALRSLGSAVRYFVLAAAALATATGAYLGAQLIGASAESAPAERLLGLVAILGLTLLLIGGRRLLERFLFASRPGKDDKAFFRSLSPELGTIECCRRALAEVTNEPHIRGAGVLLSDGTPVTHGELDLEPVSRLWSQTAVASLPEGPFSAGWVPDAQLREALTEADVLVALPIVSPQRRWGHLLISTDFAGFSLRVEDVDSVEAFADQLALVLDAADLLVRVVHVERSLAHAEKLAAIGETAARIAHEIRNPITAARSLAQQLAREPGSPHSAEHELILEELEQVERQVAKLLRFARPDEFRFGPVDLGELVRMTVDRLRARLDDAGIRVVVDASVPVVARGDREKLGQVLINLLENAADALKDTPRERRWIRVATAGSNGTATLRVSDGGPGVPADALPRLFEPFFSLKEHGTGLGLAIVKRTVEGHGGRIDAESRPTGGLEFRIELEAVRH
jgi:signal transduction histidine kinase